MSGAPGRRPATTPAAPRLTADERRDELIDAAIEAFAVTGLHGTAVSTITNAVGITQPYAFSLFGSKKGLFLAAVDRCIDQLERLFTDAANSAPEASSDERLHAMAVAFNGLTDSAPSLLHLQLQCFAASGSDADVRALVNRRFGGVFELIQDLAGIDQLRAREFLGQGMLCMLSDVLVLDTLRPDVDDLPGFTA